MNPTPPAAATDRAERLRDLVADALELPPAERAAFLADTTATGDPDLLAEARALLGHDRAAGDDGDDRGFLATPAAARVDPAALAGAGGGELQPGDAVGDCRIVSLLGEGGMGEVYLAEDTALGRPVALKLLKRRLGDEALRRRFRHERRVLAALNHPHIARLYAAATTPEGRPYLVMEHVEGEALDRFCAPRDLDVDGRLALFQKVCAAVAYAHQNLIVHRDLKPGNILVTAAGEPKLLDFGIAKLLEPEGVDPAAAAGTLTLLGAMTPAYASPEQLRGETITTASDVYSLGVILYELLAGQRPYRLTTARPDELARAICEQEPTPPSRARAAARAVVTGTNSPGAPVPAPTSGELPPRERRRLRGDLDNIVAKALRKEPARRHEGVAQLAEDLRRHRAGLPVAARPDTLAYRTGKFVRRHRVPVAAAALGLLAVVGGLGATVWQARAAGQERAQRLAMQAYSLLTEGDLGGAEAALREADERFRATGTARADTAPYAFFLCVRGWLDYLRGDYAAAEADFGAAEPCARAHTSLDSPDFAAALTLLAISRTRQGKAAEAEPLLREVLPAARAHRMVGNASPDFVAAALGECLQAQGRYAEAEAPLRDGYEGLRGRLGASAPLVVQAAARLRDLYTAWGKPAEAARFAAEAGAAPARVP